MIKLLIFDLDGVLIDSRNLHYIALNEALKELDEKYMISLHEHLTTFDGLSTTKKLKMLSQKKGLPLDKHDLVWNLKQQKTFDILRKIDNDYNKINQIKKIKEKLNIKIAVASNSIRESVKLMLLKTGILEYIDFYISNEDVKNPKPNSEMYLRCCIIAGVNPNETIIVEDSHIGRLSAISSSAHLYPVKNSISWNEDELIDYINKLNTKGKLKMKWQGLNTNILIPMAGEGSRFVSAGYVFPKPLIEINGKPMIQLVVENINIDGNYIFIVKKEHYERYHLQTFLNLIVPNCKIIQVDNTTQGAACTTLLAKEFINNEQPLLICNSDQFIEWESNEFMYSMESDNIDAGILTFKATHPKWSFAKLDENGYVSEVAEKNPISDNATVGIYYWKNGCDYVKYAEQMIEKNIRTNNEFYVCPVFNEAILDNKKIKTFNIEKMWGLGDPDSLKYFLDNYKMI